MTSCTIRHTFVYRTLRPQHIPPYRFILFITLLFISALYFHLSMLRRQVLSSSCTSTLSSVTNLIDHS